MLKNDPGYAGRVGVGDEEEKRKLLHGCWKFTKAGKLFKWDWFNLYSVLPFDLDYVYITTDTASSLKTSADYTVFHVWGKKDNKIYSINQVRGRFSVFNQIETLNSLVIQYKARLVSIEMASTGISLAQELRQRTPVLVHEMVRKKDKYLRGMEVQPFIEQGLVYLPSGAPYYTDFMNEVTAFSPENINKKVHDDQADNLIDAVYLAFIEKVGYIDQSYIKPRYIGTIKQEER